MGGSRPTVHARVAHDAEAPDQLTLQYRNWWVYNDWNDRHEGDWEMIQLVFDAPTAEAALTTRPRLAAYAQHVGSEVADWANDDKVAKVDGHPVVYPAQGSHAAFYTQAVWFGESAATGFGCDDTSTPGAAIEPEVVLLPEDVPTSSSDQFAWLAYHGRWGEQAPSFNNGPTGPATKDQWSAPVLWVADEGRPASVALPPVPGIAAEGYCGMVESGSMLVLALLRSPVTVLVLVALVGIAVAAAVRRTRWRGGRPDEIDRERLRARAEDGSPSFTAAVRGLRQRPTPALTLRHRVGGAVAALHQLLAGTDRLVLLSMWAVSFVASSVEGLGVRDSFRRSQVLTHTRRFTSTLLALMLLYLAVLSGPVVGGLLLLVTGWPVALCSAIAAAVTAPLVPIPAIGMGLLFHDLRQELAMESAAVARRGRAGVSGLEPPGTASAPGSA